MARSSQRGQKKICEDLGIEDVNNLTNWLCRCGEKRKRSSLTSGNCPIYDDIWEKRGDLENLEDLIKLFSAVLEGRDLLDRLEKRKEMLTSLFYDKQILLQMQSGLFRYKYI